MDKMLRSAAAGLMLMSSTPGGAEEVSISAVLPEPALTMMEITPSGEVVQIRFEDDKVIDNPEIDIQSLRDIDIVEVYILPFDLWFLEIASSKNRLCHDWLSNGCRYIADYNVLFHLDEHGEPAKITDLQGKEVPVEWNMLARLDGGKASIIGRRTFTMIDYLASPNGEMQRRILKDPGMTAK